jgi:ABC-type transport system involved in cytochrome c biogenesis permease subunit
MNVADEISAWSTFFFAGWGLTFTLYVIAQTVAIVRLSGQARVWAAVPIPFMALVLYVTLSAFAQQSNLWPIVMILTSPVALAYVLVVGVVVFFMRRRAKVGSGGSGAI